jgi:hypothetical protein
MFKDKEDDFDDEIIISFARCPSQDEYGRGVMERRSICVCGTVKDGVTGLDSISDVIVNHECNGSELGG